MKSFLIVFCSFALVSSIAALAYNSGKGPIKQSDGITEWQQSINDSLVNRGKNLINQSHYTDQDLEAIAAYLKNK